MIPAPTRIWKNPIKIKLNLDSFPHRTNIEKEAGYIQTDGEHRKGK